VDSQLQSSGKEPPADKPTEAPQPPPEPTRVEVSAPARFSGVGNLQTVPATCPGLPCVSVSLMASQFLPVNCTKYFPDYFSSN